MQTATQTPPKATPSENKRCITQMRRRFERWELTHLRELAASLHGQLEEAIAQADTAERHAHNAERCADHWRDHAMALQDEVLGAPGCQISIGLSKDGALHILDKTNGHMTDLQACELLERMLAHTNTDTPSFVLTQDHLTAMKRLMTDGAA
ncbi:hypothetical protein [Rhodoferax ferrireducens]|uniref:hypothetical protein n=1 Tax=Rhodoferax ferrireducens TaxID=192843 RepID=UPI000E0D218F|nr:hypothetical protein [Rhodoferax ferrireducens]